VNLTKYMPKSFKTMKKDERMVATVLTGAAVAGVALYLHHLSTGRHPASPGARVMGFFTDTAKKLGMEIGTAMDVKTAQRYLNSISHAGLQETGSLDPATQAALKAFQHSNGIPETGTIDEETGNALQYMAAATSKSPQLQKMATLPPETQTQTQTQQAASSSGGSFWTQQILSWPGLGKPFSDAMPMAVKSAQRALNDLANASLALSGQLDQATQSAISNFQGEQGLPQTGKLDPETANALVFLASQQNPTKVKLYKRTPKKKSGGVTTSHGVTYTPATPPVQYTPAAPPVQYTPYPMQQTSGDYAVGIQSTTMWDPRWAYSY
jgi:peptidoglycan hydrolase-like protein with peptidoglycan-binding domain